MIEENPKLEHAFFYIQKKFIENRSPREGVIPVLVRMKRLDSAVELSGYSDEESTLPLEER